MNAATLLSRREQVRDELAANHRHVLSILREPERELAAVPVGDLLCWCDGLDEAAVTRVLAAAQIKWGRRLSALSDKDKAMVCFQIKGRHPETWERWRAAVAGAGEGQR